MWGVCEREGIARARAGGGEQRAHLLAGRGKHEDVLVRGAPQLHQLRGVARDGDGAAKGSPRNDAGGEVKLQLPAHGLEQLVLAHKAGAQQLPVKQRHCGRLGGGGKARGLSLPTKKNHWVFYL